MTVTCAIGVASSACGPPADCVEFNSSSVAAMRLSTSSCYEIARAVVLARTPSTGTPRLYVQDQRGGDGSAIVVKCSATSPHPCPAATAAKLPQILDGAVVTLRGYYDRLSSNRFEELYLEDIVDEGAIAARPAPATLQVADISRDARVPAKWFQVVTVDVPLADPLVMYDFSPPEMALAPPDGGCPKFEGFEVMPLSAGASAPVGCTATVNPQARTAPDRRRILVGRQFFSTFWATTDCACWATSKQHLLDPGSSLAGSITGILTFEMNANAPGGFQVFEPLFRASFPISGG
jgi:hypothetical protein